MPAIYGGLKLGETVAGVKALWDCFSGFRQQSSKVFAGCAKESLNFAPCGHSDAALSIVRWNRMATGEICFDFSKILSES